MKVKMNSKNIFIKQQRSYQNCGLIAFINLMTNFGKFTTYRKVSSVCRKHGLNYRNGISAFEMCKLIEIYKLPYKLHKKIDIVFIKNSLKLGKQIILLYKIGDNPKNCHYAFVHDNFQVENDSLNSNPLFYQIIFNIYESDKFLPIAWVFG